MEIKIKNAFICEASELKGRIEVCQIGDPLSYGLILSEIHRVLSMNSEEKRIKSEFIKKTSELEGKIEVPQIGDPLF